VQQVQWEYANAPRGGAGLDPARAKQIRDIGYGSLLTRGQTIQGRQIGEDESGVPEYEVTPGIVDFAESPTMRMARGQQERVQAREARDLSKESNLRGMQQMLGEAVAGAPLDPERARQLAGMSIGGGMAVPDIIEEALKEPEQVLKVSPDKNTILERQPDGSWKPPTKISDKAHWLNESDPNG